MLPTMQSLTTLQNAVTFAFSPENPTGTPGGGSQGKPWEKLRACVRIEPGETLEIMNTDGPGVLTHMWFTGHTGWHFILRIYWDKQETPSVEAPLGAFFGYGYSENITDADGDFPVLSSAPVLVAPCKGLNCYWQMPFLKHCRITVENRSSEKHHHLYYMLMGKRTPLPENTVYFHASYRQEKPVDGNKGYTVIDGIRGAGHYAGTALFAGVNGPNGCWVEGEAKMYIDGERYPTVNYTGTEDYFGGAYAFGYDTALKRYTPYSGLYTGLYAVLGSREKHYDAQARFMLYHWHIPDPVFFTTGFCMTLQNMRLTPHGQRARKDDFSSVAYWYQTLPTTPFLPLPEDAELDMI